MTIFKTKRVDGLICIGIRCFDCEMEYSEERCETRLWRDDFFEDMFSNGWRILIGCHGLHLCPKCAVRLSDSFVFQTVDEEKTKRRKTPCNWQKNVALGIVNYVIDGGKPAFKLQCHECGCGEWSVKENYDAADPQREFWDDMRDRGWRQFPFDDERYICPECFSSYLSRAHTLPRNGKKPLGDRLKTAGPVGRLKANERAPYRAKRAGYPPFATIADYEKAVSKAYDRGLHPMPVARWALDEDDVKRRVKPCNRFTRLFDVLSSCHDLPGGNNPEQLIGELLERSAGETHHSYFHALRDWGGVLRDAELTNPAGPAVAAMGISLIIYGQFIRQCDETPGASMPPFDMYARAWVASNVAHGWSGWLRWPREEIDPRIVNELFRLHPPMKSDHLGPNEWQWDHDPKPGRKAWAALLAPKEPIKSGRHCAKSGAGALAWRARARAGAQIGDYRGRWSPVRRGEAIG